MVMLEVDRIGKSFTMHLHGGVRLPVLSAVSFTVAEGECLALTGPSGAGKSSILKIIYGNYRCDRGRVLVRDGGDLVDVATATPRRVLALRRATIGSVSQFLRVIPRVGALDVVIAAGRAAGLNEATATARAQSLLTRLNIASHLWTLAPATFSGGEQQRINLARGFIADYAVLLLDEPTASLDADNRDIVIDLIAEKKRDGSAIVGIFHDRDVRDRVADRTIPIDRLVSAAA